MRRALVATLFLTALVLARPAAAKNQARGWALLGIGLVVMNGGIALLGVGFDGASTIDFAQHPNQRQPFYVGGAIAGIVGVGFVIAGATHFSSGGGSSTPSWQRQPHWGRPQW